MQTYLHYIKLWAWGDAVSSKHSNQGHRTKRYNRQK